MKRNAFNIIRQLRRWLYKRRIKNTIYILSLIDKVAQSHRMTRPARRSLRIIKRELHYNKNEIVNVLNDVLSNL